MCILHFFSWLQVDPTYNHCVPSLHLKKKNGFLKNHVLIDKSYCKKKRGNIDNPHQLYTMDASLIKAAPSSISNASNLAFCNREPTTK